MTRSRQGETSFNYFKMFLETVKGFPLVLQSMPPYYAANPGILVQYLGTLFPYLESVHIYLLQNDPGLPFSSAVVKPNTNTRPPRQRENRRPKGSTKLANARPHPSGTTRMGWCPKDPTALAASSFTESAQNTSPYLGPYLSKIVALNNRIAIMEASLAYGANFGMSVPPIPYANSSLFSGSRPRAHYCWLHGWNDSHPEVNCSVMTKNSA
jgi:hypothetical protein